MRRAEENYADCRSRNLDELVVEIRCNEGLLEEDTP